MAATIPNSSIVIGNTLAEMEKVVDFVAQFAAANGIPQAVTNDVNLCLDELLNNTISYGYGDQASHEIVVSLGLTDGLVVAEIRDDGKPFDPSQAIPMIPEGRMRSRRIGGLGIRFVNTLMDDVVYSRVGPYNIVQLKKKFQEGTDDGNR